MRHLFILFSIVTLAFASVASAAESPRDLVSKLYSLHDEGKGPLENPAKKQALEEFFDSNLTRLYLRDQKEADGEVGRLDFDPLYDAQDVEIKELKITSDEDEEAEVSVTFQNMGEAQRVVHLLTETDEGWRIRDIQYADGRSLKKILEAD
jgi:hypothetical protein